MITKKTTRVLNSFVAGLSLLAFLCTQNLAAFAADISIQETEIVSAPIEIAPIETINLEPEIIPLEPPTLLEPLKLTQPEETKIEIENPEEKSLESTEIVPEIPQIPEIPDIPDIPELQGAEPLNNQPSSYYPEREPTKTNLAINTDLSTGAFSYEYPIFTPPGRNGLKPELSINYNSYNADGENLFGAGWEISIPYIERIPRRGTNNMFNESYFNSSLSGELTGVDFEADGQHGKYGAQTDYGDFLDYEFNASNQWLVKDKYGTTYTFGRDDFSRQIDPGDNSRIAKWMLSEITDSNNNVVHYTYFRDNGQIYPSMIYYNNEDVNQGARIQFNTQLRDDISTSYDSGFEVKTRFRINRIEISYQASVRKTYDLSYTTGDNNYSSMLASITEGGFNIALPADRFEYKKNTDNRNWSLSDSYILPVELHNWEDRQADNGVRIFDVNGDGYDDIVQGKSRRDGASIYRVYVNRTDGTGWQLNANYNLPEAFIDWDGNDTGLRIGDVNGDGLADLLSNSGFVYINRGDGTGWRQDNNFVVPVRFINNNEQDNGVRLGDVNGDGLVDLVWSKVGNRAVYLNRGDGTGWSEHFWDVPVQFDEEKSGLADVNGDGLMDIYVYDPLDYEFEIHINKGKLIPGWNSLWQLDANYVFPALPDIQPFAFDPEELDFRFVDVNGDELLDLIFLPCGSCNSNGWWIGRQIYLNKGNGTGWQKDDRYNNRIPTSFWNGSGEATEMADVNGDGMIDFLRTIEDEFPDDPSGVFVNRAKKSNLVRDIYTKEGAQISVSYKPSPHYKNANGSLLNSALPMVLQTVERVNIRNTTDGSDIRYDYVYEGGKYHFVNPLKRKFAGFGLVTKTDTANNFEKSYFHQGNGNTGDETGDHSSKIGMLYKNEIFDNVGEIYERTRNTWGNTNLACENRPGDPCQRNFVYKEKFVTDNLNHSQYSTPKAATFNYDNRGNLIEEKSCGIFAGFIENNDIQCVSDQKITQLAYANYQNGVISGQPRSQIVRDVNGNKISETKYYYDNLGFGSVAAGNNTRTEYWRAANEYINTQQSFNQNGLLTQSVDANGYITTYAYDQHNLFPTRTTNPLNQNTNYVYDYFSGNILRVTDPNGAVMEISYDDFQRKTEERQSSSTGIGPLVVKNRYAYFDNQSPRYIRQTEFLDANTQRNTYVYFDGLDRTLQKKISSEQANVYATVDYTYNNRGLLNSTSLPYFSNGTANTARSVNNSLYAAYTYDPLGRVVSTNKATGRTTYAYANAKLRVTDENNNFKDYYQNNFDQLTRVTEYNQNVAYNTYYQYDLNGNLTRLTDAANNQQNFRYDALGRMSSKEDLHAANDNTFGTWAFAYDNMGNLLMKTDPKNQITSYIYDWLGRLLLEDYAISPGVDLEFRYDLCPNGIGRICRSKTAKVTSNYQYEKLGRVSKELKTIDLIDYLTQTTYNYQGAPSILTYPDGTRISYIYNAGGNIEAVRKNGGENLVTNIDYSPLGQMSRIVLANGVTTQNTYNQNGLYRLTNKVTTNAQGLNLQNLAYSYDAVGNIIRVNDTSQSNASKNAQYEYDNLYRLTRASISNSGNGNGTNYLRTFAYDAIGNFTLRSDLGGYLYQGNAGQNYTNPHAVTVIAGSNLSYDRNGNVTNDGRGLTMDWDYNDRLRSSTKNNVATDYYYDAGGNRAMKIVGENDVTFYPNEFFELDAEGTTKHIYAGSVLVATIESDNDTESSYYTHSDHLGGSSVVTDSAGAMVQLLDYYPFGETRIDRNFGGSEFDQSNKFTGQELDEDSGLYYYGARYYHPVIGRFMSLDPWSGDLSNPQSLNKYSYVMNNPLRYTDPTGMFWEEATAFLGGGWNTLKGIGEAVMNPVDTVKSIVNQFTENANYLQDYAGTHTGSEFVSDLKDGAEIAFNEFNEMSTEEKWEAVGEVVTGAAIGGAGAKLLKKFGGGGKNFTSKDYPELNKTLERINKGEKFPHKNDGSIFRNDPPKGKSKGLLPDKPEGYYHEYVHPTNGKTGSQRIVTGEGGEIYYSPDHYNSFTQIK